MPAHLKHEHEKHLHKIVLKYLRASSWVANGKAGKAKGLGCARRPNKLHKMSSGPISVGHFVLLNTVKWGGPIKKPAKREARAGKGPKEIIEIAFIRQKHE